MSQESSSRRSRPLRGHMSRRSSSVLSLATYLKGLEIMDGFDLKGKVVIVTGAGRGIGKAIALSFGREQCRLVLAARTKSEIERVGDEVKHLGAKGIAGPKSGRAH